MVEIKSKKVDRSQKNQMRSRIEKVLEVQKDLDHLISLYEKEAEVEEYQNFWHEMKSRNLENIKVTSRFMVTKCNR